MKKACTAPTAIQSAATAATTADAAADTAADADVNTSVTDLRPATTLSSVSHDSLLLIVSLANPLDVIRLAQVDKLFQGVAAPRCQSLIYFKNFGSFGRTLGGQWPIYGAWTDRLCNSIALDHLWNISGLDLSSIDLGSEGLEKLAPVLCHLPKLKGLDLRWNKIEGTEGVAALARAAVDGSIPRLESLSLMGNKFGPSGACTLFSSISSCKTLKNLDMAACHIKDEGIGALAAACTTPDSLPNLITLRLNSNFMSEDGARQLAMSIASGGLPALTEVGYFARGHHVGRVITDALQLRYEAAKMILVIDEQTDPGAEYIISMAKAPAPMRRTMCLSRATYFEVEPAKGNEGYWELVDLDADSDDYAQAEDVRKFFCDHCVSANRIFHPCGTEDCIVRVRVLYA